MNVEQAIVIVGAGVAGASAAISLREQGWMGQILLIGKENWIPYERPPLSKEALVHAEDFSPKPIIAAEKLSELDIEFLSGREVLSINRDERSVLLDDGTTIRYHKLLLATGAKPRALNVPIDEGCQITTLRTYEDAMRIREQIGHGRKVVVVGGGFIGLEVAASAAVRSSSVLVLEAGSRLLARAVPASVAELIRAKHEANGVSFQFNAQIKGVECVDGGTNVVLASGQRYSADLVIVGIGAQPDVALAEASGLTIDNGLSLDEKFTTSDPFIFGAGDCCSIPNLTYGRRIRLEAWRNAQQQGAMAAANILGVPCSVEEIPWFWSDQYDETLQVAGLSEGEVRFITKEMGDKGIIYYSLDADERLICVCGFGKLGAIAKEIRLSQKLISKKVTPILESLRDPLTSTKNMIALVS